MAKNVLQIFKNIIMENMNTDEKGADAFLKKMEQDKRYKADVWS
jgi:sulfite reductase alpha subunit-like flavoprotein